MRQDVKMDSSRLIMEIYKRPALWDQKHSLYHNREVTNRIWTELSTILKLPKAVLKAKWKGLRDTFRAEIKKEQIYRKSKYPRSRPIWIHYKNLQFLRDQMLPRPPIWERNTPESHHKIDSQGGNEINDHTAIVKGPKRSALSSVRHVFKRKAIQQNSNRHENNLDGGESCKKRSKKSIKAKITSTTAQSYQNCDLLDDQDLPSLQIESSMKDHLNDESVIIKHEPIDNIASGSAEHQVTTSESLNENEVLQTISSEQQVLMTRTNDTCAELSVDPLEANRLDDNYHFLMSLLPHIKTLPAERQMLLRMQMQELVYKEVYRKNTDKDCSLSS